MQASESTPHISVRSASKSYPTKVGERLVLDRASFDTSRGEFTSLIGPSGCGKTTLLRMVAGLVAPSRGSISISGEPVTRPRRDIGMVFQSPTLLPWHTVIDNILLPVKVQGRSKRAFLDRAHELLSMVGLDDCADMHPWELSGGMQQRVGICRALIHDPSVLLMDEPFAALDAMTREIMNDEIIKIWSASQKTIIFVTHSIPEAVYLSDEIVVMESQPGRVSQKVRIGIPRSQRRLDPEVIAVTDQLRARFSKEVLQEETNGAVSLSAERKQD